MVNNSTTPKKLFTLRSHSSPITCIGQIRPLRNSNLHSIITGDLEGGLVWWDISVTHRPFKIWKGHEGSIITIKQLNDRPNYILTQGKDHTVKLWDIDDLKNDGNIPNFIEIPVNTLNFCNVDYLDNQLLNAATTDSNNFDIYTLFDSSGQFSLNRIITNMDPYALSVKNEGIEFEINDDTIGDKRGKFGIMMKVVFVLASLFFIGYESGHILGFNLNNSDPIIKEASSTKIKDKMIINKSAEVKLVYENDFHKPSPILSLDLSPLNKTLLAGLADKKVLAIHLDNVPGYTTESFNTHHLGSQSITVSNNNQIGIQSWDGVLRGYDFEHNEVFKIQRDSERIHKIDTFSNNDDVNKDNKSKNKISAIKFFKLDTVPTDTALTYKQLIKSRKKTINNNLLFVGYNDGIVDVFDTGA